MMRKIQRNLKNRKFDDSVTGELFKAYDQLKMEIVNVNSDVETLDSVLRIV